MPQGTVNIQLSRIINALSKKYGGPIFNPHVTLLGGFLGKESDLLKKVKTLSNIIKPINIIFYKFNYLDDFFRPFFLEVKFSDELKFARNIACNKINYSDKNYLPHMSLAYGNYDLLTKLKMEEEVENTLDGFLAEKIFLSYNNEKDLHWEIIDYFDLMG